MIAVHIPTPPEAGPVFDYLMTDRQMRIVGGDPRTMSCLFPYPDMARLAKILADSFEQTRALRPEVPSPYRHKVFGIARGETLEWSEVVPTIKAVHGIDDVRHRYLAVQHLDRDFEHIHFFSLRVGTDGSLLRDQLRDCALSQSACRLIEQEFGLRALKSSVSLNEMKTLRRPESRPKRPSRGEHEIHQRGELTRKELAYRRLLEVWPSPGEVLSFEAFTARLKASGIEIQTNKRGSRVGLTYCFGGTEVWKASDLGRDVQWSALSPHIAAQIAPEDIDCIRSIRSVPSPAAPENSALPDKPRAPRSTPYPPTVPVECPPTPRPKPPAVDLLALLDAAYANLSRSQQEATRRRTSGAPNPPCQRGSRSHHPTKGRTPSRRR